MENIKWRDRFVFLSADIYALYDLISYVVIYIYIYIFPAFMEPESPSPYPQVPATCPYPEPTPSSPYDPLQLPEDPS